MELKQVDTLLLKLLLLGASGIVITQALGLNDWTSWLFMLTFPLTVLLWARTVRRSMTATDLLALLAIVLACISVLVNLCISRGSLNLSYFKKWIMFSMTLLFFQSASRLNINKSMVDFVNHTGNAVTVFLIAAYFLDNRSMHLVGSGVSRFLTFRFPNPNTTGLFLACLYMLELYRLFSKDKWYIKLLHIGMALFLAVFTLETQSRNSILILVFFTLACLWLEFRSRKRLHVTKFWATAIAWSPLIFSMAYMVFIYTPWIQSIFSFFVDVGKGLDSRVDIWNIALQHVGISPLFGDYYGVSNGTGVSQLHNTHLDIAASYGIPVLFMVCSLLTNYLYQKDRFYGDKESFSYILAFGCAIMLGLGEAALFSGGLGIYIYVGIFLMLSRRKTEDR